MSTKSKAEQIINSLGGAIDWSSSLITKHDKLVFVDAPAGKVWSYNDCAVIAHGYNCGPASEFWQDVISMVKDGTRDA